MHSKFGPRRRHSAELKAKVVAACDEPGASISGVALAHGLNANLVRKWRTGRGLKRVGVTVEPTPKSAAPQRPGLAASPLLAVNPEFVAIELPAAPIEPAA
jgi:transposase